MHWIYPSIGGAFFGFGLGSIADASLTVVIDSYREVSVSSTFLIALLIVRSPAMRLRALPSSATRSALESPSLLIPG